VVSWPEPTATEPNAPIAANNPQTMRILCPFLLDHADKLVVSPTHKRTGASQLIAGAAKKFRIHSPT
jgi:hypothetical protein